MPDNAAIPPFAQATAGAMGSLVSNSIVYPLDLVSTRVQTSPSASRSQASSASASGSKSGGNAKSTSTYGALAEIVRRKGISGLYQGLGTDNLSNTLSNFLFFFFRAAIVARLVRPSPSSSSSSSKRPPPTSLSPAQDLAAGALAGILSRACTTPLSNVTVRKQTHSSSTSATKEKGKGEGNEGEDDSSDDEETQYEDEPALLEIVREIVKDKGVLGLWSGFPVATLLSITPALTFYLTNILTRLLLPTASRQSPSPAQTFLLSALGNALSTSLLYPLILAKTLLQYRDPRGRRVYKGLVDVLRGTIRRRGVKGLYKGLESQLAKGVTAHGVTMVVKGRVEEGFVQAYLAAKRRGRGGE